MIFSGKKVYNGNKKMREGDTAVFLEKMSYTEVESYLQRKDTIILITGSTENHGKNMPLGTDTIIPFGIAQRIEQRLSDDIIIAPALPYGVTEDLKGFAGTISLGTELYTRVLIKVIKEFFDYGFRHFVVINGHGGNSKAIENAGLEIYRKGACLARLDWWLIAGQLRPEWKGGHGGAEEAAGVMGVDPSLIKKEYIDLGECIRNDLGDELPSTSWNACCFKGGMVTIPRPIRDITDNGWLAHGMGNDEPSKATEEWGREMLDTMADYVVDFISAFEKVDTDHRK